MQILNSTNGVVANYSYDAWGNLLSVTNASGSAITSTTNFANINPIRYRGYYYDSETGFYYLRSRYYDPANCRFISADSQIDVIHGTTNLNLFAYCGNDPVNNFDPNGTFAAAILGGIDELRDCLGSNSTGVSYVDAAMGICAVALGVLGIAVSALITSDIASESTVTVAPGTQPLKPMPLPESAPRIKCLDERVAEAKREGTYVPPVFATPIYRYGGANPGNLTPKAKDRYTGLSFSTVPKPGAAMTTIEALNATGRVYAIRDGATHVSVRPIGGTMDDWINEGPSSIWTQTVKSVLIKWE